MQVKTTTRKTKNGKVRYLHLVHNKLVAVAPAVRQDGRVQAGGHPADRARLGCSRSSWRWPTRARSTSSPRR